MTDLGTGDNWPEYTTICEWWLKCRIFSAFDQQGSPCWQAGKPWMSKIPRKEYKIVLREGVYFYYYFPQPVREGFPVMEKNIFSTRDFGHVIPEKLQNV